MGLDCFITYPVSPNGYIPTIVIPQTNSIRTHTSFKGHDIQDLLSISGRYSLYQDYITNIDLRSMVVELSRITPNEYYSHTENRHAGNGYKYFRELVELLKLYSNNGCILYCTW